MTHNAFFLFLLLVPSRSAALVESPVVQGLGGAMRSGVPREALFANPASVALIENTFGFYHYQIPKIPDLQAGGRAWSAGLYDGGDRTWKGGFGYSRVAKARVFQGRQSYVDRSELRFATGHAISGEILGGLAARRVSLNSPGAGSSHFDGDIGLMFPVFADIRGGLSYENALNKEDELPSTLGAGANYGVGYGLILFADGYRLMSGSRSGERGWALAVQWAFSESFFFRGALYEEAYRAVKGWSAGASWFGPRTSIDWVMKSSRSVPREKSHTLGITVTL